MLRELKQRRFTFGEAARETGVNLCTIWRWVLRGARKRKLRSIHIGGRRYILASDLEAFLSPASEVSFQSSIPGNGEEFRRRAKAAGEALERIGV
jgi:hypothetical protein